MVANAPDTSNRADCLGSRRSLRGAQKAWCLGGVWVVVLARAPRSSRSDSHRLSDYNESGQAELSQQQFDWERVTVKLKAQQLNSTKEKKRTRRNNVGIKLQDPTSALSRAMMYQPNPPQQPFKAGGGGGDGDGGCFGAVAGRELEDGGTTTHTSRHWQASGTRYRYVPAPPSGYRPQTPKASERPPSMRRFECRREVRGLW